MDAVVTTCFHCGEALAGRPPLRERVGAADAVFCCPGCLAAAQLIQGLGLGDFYRFRTAPANRPDGVVTEYGAYDSAQMLEALTRGEAGARSVLLLIDGLTCAACSWLITRALLHIDGVARASVNAATGRAHMVWDRAGYSFRNCSRASMRSATSPVRSLRIRPAAMPSGSIMQCSSA